ncbi:MAG: hypothetical protein K6U02_05880 [Firmicutes bacterium]|nr:hypothetical protein [Bacillota bacterium]
MRCSRCVRANRSGSLLDAVAVAALLFTLPAADSERVQWKPVGLAALVLGGRTVEDWQIYQAEERNQFLVRIGRRYLLLDTATRQLWELGPEQFRQEGEALVSPTVERLTTESQPENEESPDPMATTAPPTREARQGTTRRDSPVVRHRWPRRVPTEQWVDRHAGRARLIQVRLTEEGRLLELQIPLSFYEQIRR